jgi:agmatinase
MKTSAVFFPFDLFGSAGTAAGVTLIADELREILSDNRRETVPTRARCYTDQLRLREFAFEKLDDYADWRAQGRRVVRSALRSGDFLLWVTGNHLGALPVYDELSQLGDEVMVVQLDAHLDIHHFHDTTTELSHGNFLLHCDGTLPPLVNVGHRDLLLMRDHVAKSYRATFSAAELAIDPTPALKSIRSAGEGRRVFLDLDCDVFDPMFFPAVTTPVPFGLSPGQVLALVDAACASGLSGLLISEFDPGRDRDDRSLSAVMWLIEYVLLRRYETAPGAD